MKPYIIRKCKSCHNWHLYKVFSHKNGMTYFVNILTFIDWWDEALIFINFPEMIEEYI